MEGSALTLKSSRGKRKVIFRSSNLRVKEIVLQLNVFSYCEFSKKDLQFEFTLGASAVSEIKRTAKIFFSLQCDLWKISSL